VLNLEERLRRFIARAREVSAEVHRVKRLEDALAHVLTLRLGRGGVAAVGWDAETIKRLERQVGDAGLFDRGLRQHADAIGVGFTPASWGVAETGTLIIDGADEDLRLATMLPDVHVALLPQRRVVERLVDLADVITGALSAPGYLAMITGPSRTADVERVLTIGVHGPRELHILLLEDDG